MTDTVKTSIDDFKDTFLKDMNGKLNELAQIMKSVKRISVFKQALVNQLDSNITQLEVNVENMKNLHIPGSHH